MVFSSLVFLWIFLPVVFVLCLIIPGIRGKNLLLLFASLFFYAWGEPVYLFLLLFSILLNWCFGLLMERKEEQKKLYMILALSADLLLLCFFKYTNFILNTLDHLLPFVQLPRANIPLPIGISFFTFQAMSYIIDLYRGEYRAQKSLIDLALYISFFPQLIAGPIVKYRDIDTQLSERKMTAEGIAVGMRRFLYGLGKKVILANMLAIAVDRIYDLDPAGISVPMAWCASLCYTLQIYYDFSGYSDMAIGLGRIFGFEFLENFRYPYISGSVKEFWRRWHISLSSWFREYLYIPLGGNRKGQARTYLNLIIVFAVTGLWHGASWSFVFWGLFHGAFLLLERIWLGKYLEGKDPLRSGLSWLYTFFVVNIGWVFFRAEHLSLGLTMVGKMFGIGAPANGVPLGSVLSTQIVLAFVFGIIGMGCLTALPEKLREKWRDSLPEALFLLLVLFYSIVLLANQTYNPFIYFRF